MKPTNLQSNNTGPVISSNSVVWQGPDITCINLCKGDTISDVIYKLATELCTIMKELDITNYHLECLNLAGCAPSSFIELLQILINKICILSATSTDLGRPTASTTCPECPVTIAPCFRYVNPLGDTVTELPLADYVVAIGNRICSIVSQITTIQNTLVEYNIRITNLENEPAPTLILPQIVPVCVLPSVLTDMDEVLIALENQFCELRGATGTALALYTAILKQCTGLAASDTLSGTGTMSAIPGWVISPTTVADTLTNLWLTICDMRAAIQNIQLNCCPSGCDGIILSITAAFIEGGNFAIYLTGTIPAGFVPCGGGNTNFTISDGVNSTIVSFNILTYLNDISGYQFTLPGSIDTGANLLVTATPCLYNTSTESTCQSVLSYNYLNLASCPILTLEQSMALSTTLDWSFTVATTGIYTVELYDNSDVFVTSTTTYYTPGLQTGSFTGLSYVTYKVRIKINSVVTCEFVNITLIDPEP